MKTFSNFCAEAYDAAVMSGSQIRRMGGDGTRVGTLRKKSKPETVRTSQKKDTEGNRIPTDYKDRTDISTQKQASTRVQQPTQERGSADVKAKAAAAAKEESRKAAQARAAAKSGGEKPKPKEKPKDLSQQASKILAKTKPAEVDKRPADQPKRAVKGIDRKERSQITRKGQEKLERLVRQSEAEKQGKKPEDVVLKHKYRTW